MRTTLTLDPDVARLIKEEAHRQRKPVKQVVNEAIRRALTSGKAEAAGARKKKYRVREHHGRLLPGLDAGRLNALSDELEEAALVKRLGRRKPR